MGEQNAAKDYSARCPPIRTSKPHPTPQFIRMSNIIDDMPLRKRLEILARLHEQFEQYSVHELCEALNISVGHLQSHFP